MTLYKDLSPEAQAKARAYQRRPDQQEENRLRKQARRDMIEKHGAAALKGKDVGHIRPLDDTIHGANRASNLEIQSYAKNRGYRRDRANNPL